MGYLWLRMKATSAGAGAVLAAITMLALPVSAAAAGGWTIVSSPNPTLSNNNNLIGVTCTSPSDCWAVGYYENGIAVQTLIEHNTGGGWSIVSSPNPGGTRSSNLLYGVTCTGPSNCWAVGYYTSGSTYQTLIEQYTGSGWSVVSSPNLSSGNNTLWGVTCTSPSDCWTVGNYYNPNVTQTLIEHNTGSGWNVVSSPNSGTSFNRLYGVTCPAANDCWAVGNYYNKLYQTLIEHNTGSGWNIDSSPNSGSFDNSLQGVTCASPSNCWAVGWHYNTSIIFETLIEQNTGSGWSIIGSPNLGTKNNLLYGVACPGPNDCWAVGYYDNGTAYQTLIEHNTGSGWSIVSSPNAGTGNNFIVGVSCPSSSDCSAVGANDTGTLIEHYSAVPPADVPEAPAGSLEVAAGALLAIGLGWRRRLRSATQ